MRKTEFRYCELRAEGERRLSGVVVTYGEIGAAPFGKELFEARAFGDLSEADVILNTMHDRRRPLARTRSGLTITDDERALSIAAELPATREADDTLELVRAGVFRGLSIEFTALRERVVSGVRRIQSARLSGVGVVDRPAYPGSEVQARGANLARVLETELTADGSSRSARVSAMAAGAGIDPETVEQILDSEIDHPTLRRFQGFARVLRVPLSRLVDAVIADGANPDLYRGGMRRVWL